MAFTEKLLEKRQVTEYRDGLPFKTKSLGEFWMPIDTVCSNIPVNDILYTPITTKRMKELNFQDYR